MAKQTDQKRREGKGSVYFLPSLEHGYEMPPEPPAEESTAEGVLKQMYELLKGMQGVKCIYV